VFPTGTKTIKFSIKPENNSNTSQYILSTYYVNGDGGDVIKLESGLLTWNGGNTVKIQSITSLIDGKWHDVELKFNNDTRFAEMYIDGILNGTSTSFPIQTLHYKNLRVGKSWGTSSYPYFYKGYIANIQVFDIVLDQEIYHDTNLEIQTSTDLVNWTTHENGGELFPPNTEFSGLLYLREKLATDNPSYTPKLEDLTITIITNLPPNVTVTNATFPTISWNCSDSDGTVVRSEIKVNGVSKMVFIDPVGELSYTLTEMDLNTGSNTITIDTEDDKGSITTKTFNAVKTYVSKQPLELSPTQSMEINGALSIVGDADPENYVDMTKKPLALLSDGVGELEIEGRGSNNSKSTIRLTMDGSNHGIRKITGYIK
jgi:hypothetical protein